MENTIDRYEDKEGNKFIKYHWGWVQVPEFNDPDFNHFDFWRDENNLKEYIEPKLITNEKERGNKG